MLIRDQATHEQMFHIISELRAGDGMWESRPTGYLLAIEVLEEARSGRLVAIRNAQRTTRWELNERETFEDETGKEPEPIDWHAPPKLFSDQNNAWVVVLADSLAKHGQTLEPQIVVFEEPRFRAKTVLGLTMTMISTRSGSSF